MNLRPHLIDRAGVYDLTMPEYRGDCCVGPSVSGTDLVVLEQDTLAHWHYQSYLNPDREEESSPSMDLGIVAHYVILGETSFAARFVVSPFDDFRSGEARQWRDAQAQKKIVLTKKQFDTVGEMAMAIGKHPFARNAFRDGVPEQSLVWHDKETGIWLKSRPDWLPNRSNVVPDLKTTNDANPRTWMRKAFDFGYHQKEALRIEGFRHVLDRPCMPYFVVQETKKPYLVSVVTMRDTDLEIGHILNRKALRRLADALAKGKFPGYGDDRVIEIAIPGWKEKEFLDRHAAGEFEGIEEARNAMAERGPAKEGVYGN